MRVVSGLVDKSAHLLNDLRERQDEFVAHKGSVCGVQFVAINVMAVIDEDLRGFYMVS